MSYEALAVEIFTVVFMVVAFYAGYKSTKKREQEGKSLVEKSDLKVLGCGLLAIFTFGIISLLLIL